MTSVAFGGTAATFAFVDDHTVTAVVPDAALTGPIALATPSGTGTSNKDFTVLTPYERTIPFTLSHHLRVTGQVVAVDEYAACVSVVPVVILWLHAGRRLWVTTTATRADGRFRATILDRHGRYRARAKRITLMNDEICAPARSPVVHH